MGSSPMQCTGLAQPVERSPFKAVVTGSNPVACIFAVNKTNHNNHTNHTSSICG